MRKSTIFMHREVEGHTAASLINPAQQTRTDKFQRNARSLIRQKQEENREKAAQENIPPTPIWKSKKFSKVESKVSAVARPRTAGPPPSPPRKALENAKCSNKNFGKVPAYLRNIKQGLANAQQDKIDKLEAARHPGERLLSEAERVEMLQKKRAEKDELLLALHQLPLGRDNISLQLRRKKIESEIHRVDREIKTYDRKQVYVRQ